MVLDLGSVHPCTLGGYFIIQSPYEQVTNTTVSIGFTGVAVDREAIESFTLTIQVSNNTAPMGIM